jgi:hypothetical protein
MEKIHDHPFRHHTWPRPTLLGKSVEHPRWGILLVVRKNYGNGIFVGDDYTMPICRDLAPFLLGNISRLVNSDV